VFDVHTHLPIYFLFEIDLNVFTGYLHYTGNESNRYIQFILSELNEESDQSQSHNILQQLKKTRKK